MAIGKKTCPNCDTEIGARTYLCKCGYHYPSGKVREDLLIIQADFLREKMKPAVHTTEGRGRKKCPKCGVIVGVRTKTCPCGYDYTAHTKERTEEKEKEKREKKENKKNGSTDGKEDKKDKMSPQTAEILVYLSQHPYKAPPVLTKRDNAERILSYGKERASVMLLLHKNHHYWPHIDWVYVEEKLTG